ncbi:MAG: EAL domain-containing protein [Acidobacteriota bacterium]|nr:EAL domain-containing protein [Acidobacteriota bacterium]
MKPTDTVIPFSSESSRQKAEIDTGFDESSLDNVYFRQLFRSSPQAIVLLDNQDRVIDANRAFEDTFYYSVGEARGRSINSLIVPDELVAAAEQLSARTLAAKVVATETIRKRKDGSTCAVRILGYPIVSGDQQIGIFAIYDDISIRRRFERRLKLQGAAMDSAANAIFITDRDGRIEWTNRAFTRLSGYRESEAVGATPLLIDAKGSQPGLDPSEWRSLAGKGVWRGHVVSRHRDGHTYTVEQTVTPLQDHRSGIDHYVVVQEDISDRIEAEERLHHMARHDFLTDLPNRYTFNERLNVELDRASRSGRELAVFVLDLDHFKDVNDSFGHPVGDDLLVAVGRRLKRVLRDSSPLARLGGDEFGIVQVDLQDPENARGLAGRLLAAFDSPFVLRGQEVHVTPSIGIALYPPGLGDSKSLIKKADMAMYRAKQAGRATFRFYEEEMDHEVQTRMQLGQDLHAAITREELYLDYQPQIDLKRRDIIGVEALLRWQHPERGLVPPDRFIPLAEGSGLIIPIGRWVMETACAQAKIWQEQHGIALPVAVNLSSIQFRDPQFVESVERILKETGLAPELLELELTEGILMQASTRIERILQRLCEIGVRLSLDDFGKGYSSLEYLRRIPLQKLKIDRSFVQGIGNGSHDPVIVSVIVALAKKLGLELVAEGVETKKQLDFLEQEECDYLQGFYFSRPVDPTKIEQLLTRGTERISPVDIYKAL